MIRVSNDSRFVFILLFVEFNVVRDHLIDLSIHLVFHLSTNEFLVDYEDDDEDDDQDGDGYENDGSNAHSGSLE